MSFYMSIETQKQLKVITNLIGAIGIAACALIFNDMRNDLKKVAADIVELRERVSRMEGKQN